MVTNKFLSETNMLAGNILEADAKDLKKKYDKPKFSYLYWPVVIPGYSGVDDELHITAKFLGTDKFKHAEVFDLIKDKLQHIDLNALEWEAVEFDTKSDGKVKVLEFKKFPQHMQDVHDALHSLRADDYPNYRPHVTVPAELWGAVKETKKQPLDVGMAIGPIELKVHGTVYNVEHMNEGKGRKLVGDELEACALYFGLSNLGLADGRVNKWVHTYAGNMKKLRSLLDGELVANAESDGMYDQMMDEVSGWRRDAAKGDEWVIETWDKLKATGERK